MAIQRATTAEWARDLGCCVSRGGAASGGVRAAELPDIGVARTASLDSSTENAVMSRFLLESYTAKSSLVRPVAARPWLSRTTTSSWTRRLSARIAAEGEYGRLLRRTSPGKRACDAAARA